MMHKRIGKELSAEGIEIIMDYWQKSLSDPETLDKKKAYYYIGLMLDHIEILLEQTSQENKNDNTREITSGSG